MDPITKEMKKVPVLLDTGAEIFFIDTAVVEELHLPTVKSRLHTLGFDEIQETSSRKVPFEAWDAGGHPLSLILFTHDILTKPFVTAPVCMEDVDLIRQESLPFNLRSDSSIVKPSILLACDQLWTLMKNDEPHVQLPSGLRLVPTCLGYLLTGQVKTSIQVEQHHKYPTSIIFLTKQY
ncbi:hypothetical protein RB195_024574 [Necator americanus]|uniref:Peptidase aspartic putative domain-containing protein n=1 Tax=Necator americanus TaxID=51031 RepID=A0ABR1ENQ9_NECAM